MEKPGLADARRDRQLQMLQELAEIGMDIARAVKAEALARLDETPAAPSRFAGADLGLVFSRVAKAVRQTVALEIRIAEGLEIARAEQRRRQANEAQLELQHRQEDVREYVAEAVEADAERRGASDREVERLLDDLDERLEDGQYDDRLADAPFPELIARICADLGVIPDWRLWKDHDWGAEYLREHTPTDIGAERWLGEDPAAPPATSDSS